MPSDCVVIAREEWDRIRQLEATIERLQTDLAVAVGNPCAGCQADVERLRRREKDIARDVSERLDWIVRDRSEPDKVLANVSTTRSVLIRYLAGGSRHG